MANVPFPLTAQEGEYDYLKSQLYEMLRQVYEDKIGGADLGDVFAIVGDILTLVIADNAGLIKTGNVLAINPSSTGGLYLLSNELLLKLITTGGLQSNASGLGIKLDGTSLSLSAAGLKVSVNIIPPQNLLPNSRFGVFSQYLDMSIGGAIAVTGHTTGANQVVASTADTQNLAIGKQVRFTAGDASLTTCPHTITGLVTNVSFTFNLEGNELGAGGGAATAYESSIGDSAGAFAYACDHWLKTIALKFCRILTSEIGSEPRPNSLYTLQLTKGSSSLEEFKYQFLKSDHPGQVAEFAGRSIVLGMWVYTTHANAVRIWIYDGVTQTYSAYATANQWTWLEVTAMIGNYSDISALYIGAYLTGSTSDIHYITCPMLSYGTYLGTGNYFPIKNEIIHTIAHISPTHYTGATIAGGDNRIFRIHDETHGQIPRDAKGIYAAFEGTGTTVNKILAWWRNGLWDPLTHGHILNSQVAGMRAFSPVAPIQISYSGEEVYQYLYVESGEWTLVSMDIVGVWY